MDTAVVSLQAFRERPQHTGFRGAGHAALDRFLDRLEDRVMDPESGPSSLTSLTQMVPQEERGVFTAP